MPQVLARISVHSSLAAQLRKAPSRSRNPVWKCQESNHCQSMPGLIHQFAANAFCSSDARAEACAGLKVEAVCRLPRLPKPKPNVPGFLGLQSVQH